MNPATTKAIRRKSSKSRITWEEAQDAAKEDIEQVVDSVYNAILSKIAEAIECEKRIAAKRGDTAADIPITEVYIYIGSLEKKHLPRVITCALNQVRNKFDILPATSHSQWHGTQYRVGLTPKI